MPGHVVGNMSIPLVAVVDPVTGLPGAGGLTNAQLRAAAVATEPLGIPTTAHQLAATTTSQSQALSAGCRRVSIRARGADIRYVIGVGAQTASATTSHFLAQDERLDWAVPAGAHIARIRDSAATADGSLAVTEIG